MYERRTKLQRLTIWISNRVSPLIETELFALSYPSLIASTGSTPSNIHGFRRTRSCRLSQPPAGDDTSIPLWDADVSFNTLFGTTKGAGIQGAAYWWQGTRVRSPVLNCKVPADARVKASIHDRFGAHSHCEAHPDQFASS